MQDFGFLLQSAKDATNPMFAKAGETITSLRENDPINFLGGLADTLARSEEYDDSTLQLAITLSTTVLPSHLYRIEDPAGRYVTILSSPECEKLMGQMSRIMLYHENPKCRQLSSVTYGHLLSAQKHCPESPDCIPYLLQLLETSETDYAALSVLTCIQYVSANSFLKSVECEAIFSWCIMLICDERFSKDLSVCLMALHVMTEISFGVSQNYTENLDHLASRLKDLCKYQSLQDSVFMFLSSCIGILDNIVFLCDWSVECAVSSPTTYSFLFISKVMKSKTLRQHFEMSSDEILNSIAMIISGGLSGICIDETDSGLVSVAYNTFRTLSKMIPEQVERWMTEASSDIDNMLLLHLHYIILSEIEKLSDSTLQTTQEALDNSIYNLHNIESNLPELQGLLLCSSQYIFKLESPSEQLVSSLINIAIYACYHEDFLIRRAGRRAFNTCAMRMTKDMAQETFERLVHLIEVEEHVTDLFECIIDIIIESTNNIDGASLCASLINIWKSSSKELRPEVMSGIAQAIIPLIRAYSSSLGPYIDDIIDYSLYIESNDMRDSTVIILTYLTSYFSDTRPDLVAPTLNCIMSCIQDSTPTEAIAGLYCISILTQILNLESLASQYIIECTNLILNDMSPPELCRSCFSALTDLLHYYPDSIKGNELQVIKAVDVGRAILCTSEENVTGLAASCGQCCLCVLVYITSEEAEQIALQLVSVLCAFHTLGEDCPVARRCIDILYRIRPESYNSVLTQPAVIRVIRSGTTSTDEITKERATKILEYIFT